jgi:hypothetical protein
MPLAFDNFADFLVTGGGAVGGATAIAGVLGFVTALVLRDLSELWPWAKGRGFDKLDPLVISQYSAALGGLVGFGTMLAELAFGG